MTEAVIRRIRADEGKALRQIRLQAIRDTPEAFGSSLAETLARTDGGWTHWASSSASGMESVMFVAEADSAWIGMAGCRFDSSRPQSPAHMISMWVAPPYRGQGLGRMLVERIAGWARDAGARRLELCVTEGNVAAVALYVRSGFTETGQTEPLRSNPTLTLRGMARDL